MATSDLRHVDSLKQLGLELRGQLSSDFGARGVDRWKNGRLKCRLECPLDLRPPVRPAIIYAVG
jgi:hypothetical protein